MKKKIIAVVGKTCSGKDTIVNYIEKHYDIHPIVSFTTRPKRENETDGVEHWFISDEQMDELMAKGNVFAYTEFSDTRYCSTPDAMKGDIATYIIDPNGIETLNTYNVDYFSIYVDLDESSICSRAKMGGDSDDVIERRLSGERLMFDTFKQDKKYDYIVNTKKARTKVFAEIDKILHKELGGDNI